MKAPPRRILTAGLLDLAGVLHQIFAGVDGTRSADDDDLFSAVLHVLADGDDRVLFLELAGNHLVRLGNGRDHLDGVERLELVLVKDRAVADDADDDALGARRNRRLVAELLDFGDNLFDVLLRDAAFQRKNHGLVTTSLNASRKTCSRPPSRWSPAGNPGSPYSSTGPRDDAAVQERLEQRAPRLGFFPEENEICGRRNDVESHLLERRRHDAALLWCSVRRTSGRAAVVMERREPAA